MSGYGLFYQADSFIFNIINSNYMIIKVLIIERWNEIITNDKIWMVKFLSEYQNVDVDTILLFSMFSKH